MDDYDWLVINDLQEIYDTMPLSISQQCSIERAIKAIKELWGE